MERLSEYCKNNDINEIEAFIKNVPWAQRFANFEWMCKNGYFSLVMQMRNYWSPDDMLEYAVEHNHHEIIEAMYKHTTKNVSCIDVLITTLDSGKIELINRVYRDLKHDIYWANDYIWKHIFDVRILQILIDCDAEKVGLRYISPTQMNLLLDAGTPLAWFIDNVRHFSKDIEIVIALHMNILGMIVEMAILPKDLWGIVVGYII